MKLLMINSLKNFKSSIPSCYLGTRLSWQAQHLLGLFHKKELLAFVSLPMVAGPLPSTSGHPSSAPCIYEVGGCFC